MSKKESVQKRLQKVRPPRVQMTYDVEIGDAIENKELPFVMGVVGDFGGNSEVEQKRLQKVRPPRVQMTYDVEIGDAIENKELPFVMLSLIHI